MIRAGPAGAMLARLIERQYRVLLAEKRRLDEPEGLIMALGLRSMDVCAPHGSSHE
jgi:flavin-dependent dehydrogenase